MQPATRKVVKRAPSHTVRQIPLKHIQPEPVEADSSVESDFVRCAAQYIGLTSIRHQPFKLNFEDSSYTPDFLLVFEDDSRLVVEVKPTEKVAGNRNLFDKAYRKLRAAGMLFMVAEDSVIRARGRAEIAKRIRRYAKASCPATERDRILALCQSSHGGLCISEFLHVHMVQKATLFHLIATRVLCTLPAFSIEDATRVVIPQNNTKGESHAYLFASWLNAEIWGTHP